MSERTYKIFIAIFIILMLVLFVSNMGHVEGYYSDDFEPIPMYVTADNLNLRMTPSKKGVVATGAENGDQLSATGKWSKDYKWIEIWHPEMGYLWCNYHYVTERTDHFLIETLWDTPIKIRNQAFNGRVVGYLRKGKTLEITQVVLGWGKSRQGWIDLSYCIEIGE